MQMLLVTNHAYTKYTFLLQLDLNVYTYTQLRIPKCKHIGLNAIHIQIHNYMHGQSTIGVGVDVHLGQEVPRS